MAFRVLATHPWRDRAGSPAFLSGDKENQVIYGATNNPLRPLADEIKAVAALGFDYLELCLDPPNGLPGLLQPRSAEVKSTLAGVGLGLPVVHLPTFVALADIYSSIREASVTEVFKALDLAAHLGAKKAVLHPGYLNGPMNITPEIGRGYALESLGRVLERAAGHGITICLENMFPRAGHMYCPEEFVEVLRGNPGLMMTLDLAHANVRAPGGRSRHSSRWLAAESATSMQETTTARRINTCR